MRYRKNNGKAGVVVARIPSFSKAESDSVAATQHDITDESGKPEIQCRINEGRYIMQLSVQGQRFSTGLEREGEGVAIRLLSCAVLCRAVWQKGTSLSEVGAASICKIQENVITFVVSFSMALV